ncbi:MAG: glycosyltransferase family 25 protein [Nitrospinae bacterium]|nr:glycosyltransferase family 25 protein [Nitrospinota bacterium]
MDIAPHTMKCIVINLLRAEARREAMRKQFEALGMKFEIFDATDWRDLGEKDWTLVDRESRDREGRRPLSNGMIACYLSHRKALEGVAAGEDELTAVFEDDVTLAPDIGGALDAIARLYASGWGFDFVFLHRNRTDKPFAPLKRVDADTRLGITKFSDWGTQSYVVSKIGASRFLKNCPRIVHQIDHTLHAYWENGMEVFSLETPVVFDGNETGGHSFLQEAAVSRPRRNFWKLGRRAFSNFREEALKRVYFSRKVRSARNGGVSG